MLIRKTCISLTKKKHKTTTKGAKQISTKTHKKCGCVSPSKGGGEGGKEGGRHTCATNAVDIRLHSVALRHVEVDDMGDPLDVQAARSDVGGQQDVLLAGHKLLSKASTRGANNLGGGGGVLGGTHF